jgi:glycosyltransferase involved in cell wall biosynthesis
MLNNAAALHFKTAEEAALVGDLDLSPPEWIVPNGIDWNAFQTLPAPGQFRRESPVVLTHGRISHKKNIDRLIRSIPRDAHLLVAGPDDESLVPSLQALAAEVGASVSFTGMLQRQDTAAALAAADVWALPSRSENFGTAVVEALAAGLPVLVTPGVNIAPALARENAAIVCEEEEFGEKLRLLLADSALRQDLGERARRFASRYDWSQVAPQLAAMYISIANGAPIASEAA